MNHIILYCRQGFEKECAAEIMSHSARYGIHGHVNARPLTGFIVFTTAQKGQAPEFAAKLTFASLIFCRQIFRAFDEITGLPPADRITPIIAFLKSKNIQACDVFVETADTDESKKILPFCNKFTPHFERVAKKEGVLTPDDSAQDIRLHLFFISSDKVYAGLSAISNSSRWFMGIPRLRFPSAAPSRSTLKLEEAFHVFLTPQERQEFFKEGMTAVDLGASPGGWTYQLVKRGIAVEAVDNGPMDKTLMQTGLVKHIKTDGLVYTPPNPVDWMVCDIVEQPRKIAKLAGNWMARRLCKKTIFNLKLPMKKRFEEINLCIDIIKSEMAKSTIDKKYSIVMKQLYHDREEVTGFIYFP